MKLTRRMFVQSIAAGTTILSDKLGAVAKEHVVQRSPSESRPNVVFILADDLGWGDLSCYGRPDYRTPHLDSLAAQGTRFTDAYSASAVCTPTRCGYITGRYPARFRIGLEEPLIGTNHNVGLEPGQPTIASLLRQSGYETALFGKWHLGFRPEWGPNAHGFDEFFGILAGAGDYFLHKNGFGEPDLYENVTPVQRNGYLTDLLTERAVSYVQKRRRAPFFLSLHYTAPHWPWQGPKGGETTDRKFFWRIYSQDAVRDGKWKYFRNGEVRRLFDLSVDPHEQADFSQKHPEVLQRLMNEFDKWNEQMLPRLPPRR